MFSVIIDVCPNFLLSPIHTPTDNLEVKVADWKFLC